MKCQYCRTIMAVGTLQCPNRKCRMWNHVVPPDFSNSTVLLSEAIAQPVERIHTGIVDLVFGGGIVKTSVNLLAGDPGAGKTTLSLQLSDIFCHKHPNKEVLYIANEQSPEELTETAKRLELRYTKRIRIVKAMGGMAHDIGELLIKFKPSLVILDSVTKWAGEDMNMAVIICQRIKEYCVILNCPAIVINQVTKSGDHAGLNKMQHAVDMTGMFDILVDPGEMVTPETPRRLWCSKNRFGPAPIEQYFRMTGTGLIEINYEQEEEDED
jgi:DNA repair protein RadA/Sms